MHFFYFSLFHYTLNDDTVIVIDMWHGYIMYEKISEIKKLIGMISKYEDKKHNQPHSRQL